MKGKAPSTKQRVIELEKMLENMNMAMQMSQMMTKHLTNQLAAAQQDVANVMGMANDLQYRSLAMLELGSFDKDALNAKADELKLNNFNEASDKEDAEKGYVLDDSGVVTEDSIVTIKSTTPELDEDRGIFRSKFPMSECQTPNIREALMDSKVGDSHEVDLNGVKHVLEVVSLRLPTVTEETKEEATDAAE